MNKWIWVTISAVLLASAQCAARISYQERQAQARIQSIQERKRKEQEYAKRIVRNTQLQTARKKNRRNQEAERHQLAAENMAQTKQKEVNVS
jgi:hypothetical protein